MKPLFTNLAVRYDILEARVSTFQSRMVTLKLFYTNLAVKDGILESPVDRSVSEVVVYKLSPLKKKQRHFELKRYRKYIDR